MRASRKAELKKRAASASNLRYVRAGYMDMHLRTNTNKITWHDRRRNWAFFQPPRNHVLPTIAERWSSDGLQEVKLIPQPFLHHSSSHRLSHCTSTFRLSQGSSVPIHFCFSFLLLHKLYCTLWAALSVLSCSFCYGGHNSKPRCIIKVAVWIDTVQYTRKLWKKPPDTWFSLITT